ncbi:hypothetical protein [Nostoc sp. ChiVER01]|uniref:hypothetical protein n=1 Tax=Nostoc sp. ChiVER01 TaxID=3075382 RepID=UPI002AD562A2|nr:hypothetical protein [Nostoc sp. ChiVER01]MDZ8227132.1 hypothetical protein [Nostoc sp. ChiVER01]
MNLPEWNEDLNSLEAKTAAKKLSPQQKFILLVLLDEVKIWYSAAKESHRPEWFRQASIWGFPWKPGNNREILIPFFKFFGQGSEWSSSKRASWSKSLAKLEYRGLIIRNNYNCEPRLSTDTPPPKRTTAIKLTYLGYRIANLVDTQGSVFPVKKLPKESEATLSIAEINKCLDSPQVRKGTRKLSRLQKRILSVLEFRMQVVEEADIKVDNPDIAHYIDDLGFPWWLHPSDFYEKILRIKAQVNIHHLTVLICLALSRD